MDKQNGKRWNKKRIGFLAGALLVAALGVVFVSQERKLEAIRQEQQALGEEYAALEIEKQRLEYMIEYAQSEEYLLQYAREKLGYVKPGDIKFSIE
ncbi:MAG: hypothetical protein EOM66_03545 [Clostridia bacterium]|nr:septum formation initiator family protein [Candidatus Pelethousia sp.]NCB30461.1 hypothetical protein [Clostridia bacterium]